LEDWLHPAAETNKTVAALIGRSKKSQRKIGNLD
jgi:hypothetical protein